METPPALEDCPPSPPLATANDGQGTSENLDDTRLVQLKKIRDNERTMCVICWNTVSEKNRCSPENCLHIFCFECLVKWSKQKNLCPLCKKAFKIIVYNVKSSTEFETYQVVLAPPEPSHSPINLNDILLDHHNMSMGPYQFNTVYRSSNYITSQVPARRVFTFQTRFHATLEQNERIQEFFGGRPDHDNYLNNSYSRLTPAEWRKYIYDRNLYALPLPDEQGRHRESSAAFYRENPAITHRLIPWLNRELVVLIPQNTDAIPRILEEMREMLCVHDIQSRDVYDYFHPHLHHRTEHFIHEFLNFAKSPYDIMGYDRIVDYQQRPQRPVSTYEISSTESSDGEIQVVEEDANSSAAPIPSLLNSDAQSDLATVGESPSTITSESASMSSSSTVTSALGSSAPPTPPTVITPLLPPPEHTTEVVVETSSAHEQVCTFNDIYSNNISQNISTSRNEVVVESSDSDCEFVLALKPPHLRTPEQVDLNSASDSDVIYVPDTSPKIKEISSDENESEDNIPLAETKRILKQETNLAPCVNETRLDQNLEDLIPQSFLKVVLRPSEPSTSAGSRTTQLTNFQLVLPGSEKSKKYFEPKRKIVSDKSIFSSSTSGSSSSSSSSTSSDTSDDDWQSKTKRKSDKRKKTQNKRKPNTKKLKAASKLKPLCELPSSGEAENQQANEENESNNHEQRRESSAEPNESNSKRIKSVIIKKNCLTDKLYVDKPPSDDSDQSDESMEEK